MKLESITRILDGVTGIRKDGGVYLVPEEMDVSVYLALPGEALTIARVARFSPGADVAIIENAKGERFYFPAELIAGLKAGQPEAKGPRATGFR